MSRSLIRCLSLFLLVACIGPLSAADKPIKALLVTGGCCHDYDRQKLILTKGISARANVEWTIVHQGGKSTDSRIPLYEDPNWAEGFDIVVHNECFANVKDKAWVDRILKPHQDGTPAILIHCAMHCYRTGTDQWFEFVGMQSPGHGPHYSFEVENLEPEHPIMKGFGEKWAAPKGELYHSVKLFKTATPLGEAKRKSDGVPQTCIWTNDYHGTKVFCTSVGHYNETMAEPHYLDMVTRGLLWAVGRDPEKEFTATDDETDESIKKLISANVEAKGTSLESPTAVCCGPGNVATGKKASASSEESGKNNFAKNAIDGNLNTRWCANGSATGETWQVDLGEPKHVKSLRIHWEKDNAAYQYKVEASADGKTWSTIVDQSNNKKVGQITPHEVDVPDARFLKVSFLGSSTGVWGSFWEFEAYEGDLPEIPKALKKQASDGPSATIADVQAPPEFEVTLFGQPPEVNYPVCLTTAPDGTVFVGVDEQGSLGKTPGGGRVLRCRDTDGDGVADKINVFAEMDHPRGLIYDAGSLWVLHPPYLTVYHDEDLDGTSDRHETLITGISTDEVNKRGADHTTNGIRMGIDGWIYIAVGDFGFAEARGTDGTVLSRRGGGIVRVRPDGTNMEIYCWGLRNILDVSIDPYMNVFTRDNTNDGGGWDIRVTHIHQSANYGYPSLYKNFSEEIMPPLGDYGGGSGCGTMFLHDPRWPEGFGDTLYTADWGRSEVYRHNLKPKGATFEPHQEVFAKLPRPTDLDVDGRGLMYISSWKNGKFNFSGDNVGFVAQLRPAGFLPKPFPNLKAATDEQLIDYLAHESAVYRLHSQRELLRRELSNDSYKYLISLAENEQVPLYGRVAAIFTLKQAGGIEANPVLVELAKIDELAEYALRALTDRRDELSGVPTGLVAFALKSDNPRVRAQAAISAGRANEPLAEELLPLTTRSADEPAPTASPFWNQPDPGRVIPHLAVQALAELEAADACLKAIGTEHTAGALWALKYIHTEEAVSGLLRRLSTVRDGEIRREVLTTLIRLYHREGDYKGGWWGTRPDNSGPYYDRQKWEQSERIAAAIKVALTEADEKTAEHIKTQLARHKVKIEGLPSAEDLANREEEKPIQLPPVDPNNPHQIANQEYESVVQQALDYEGSTDRGKELFTSQSCIACHTYANGQNPKGPHLVDIGKRYKKPELVESILKPSAKIAQGFDTYSFILESGKVYTGFVVRESAEEIILRKDDGVSVTIAQDEIEERVKRDNSMMPEGLVKNLSPQQLADLIAYLQSLK